MKQRINHLSDALLPLGLAALVLLGSENPAWHVFWLWMAAQLLSMGISQAFTCAAASDPSMQGVKKLWTGALCIGTGVPLLLLLLPDVRSVVPIVLFFLWMELNTAWQRVRGDRFCARLNRCITAVLVLFCVALDISPLITACGICLAWLISLITALGNGIPLAAPRLSLTGQLIRSIPETMLYPLLILAWTRVPSLYRFIPLTSSAKFEILLGMALLSACRTPFRRSESESPDMVIASFLALLPPIVFTALELPTDAAFFPVCAWIIAMLLYAHLNLRIGLISIFLLVAALPHHISLFLPGQSLYVTIGLLFISLLCLIPDIRDVLRPLRAARIRRRAMR